jgi:hypothetical protein
MTQAEIDELVHRLLTGWDEALGLRVFILLAGGLILGLAVTALWKRRCSYVIGLLWFLVGAGTVLLACYPQQFLRCAVSTPYMTRIRVIIGAISLVVLFTTLESIRRTHLQERYALLWIATALVLLIAAVFPGAVAFFRAVTGTEYATAVVAVAFTFLVLVAFHFSISMSATQTKQTKIAQRIALLENRLRKLEAVGGSDPKRETGAAEGVKSSG